MGEAAQEAEEGLSVMVNWDLAPSTLAQWVGGIATSLAVAVALFKDAVIRHFRKPELRLRVDSAPPDCVFSLMTDREGKDLGWSYWIRLWVENTGSVRAEQVQVFVAKVYKRDVKGDMAPVADFVPMNLRWSNARDWKNPEIFAAGISHKMGKHCDLCSIVDPAVPRFILKGYEGQCVADLQLEVFPTGSRNRLAPGYYVLELLVGAANADPVTTYVELNLKGTWSTDEAVMFREHVGVKIGTAPRNLARIG
jgi:hypothetical protein